jgi:hypothetical protein|tara:strand:- start:1219 stop:1653 length:435 start_codon:yes stop_codon:yes gene_type:complete
MNFFKKLVIASLALITFYTNAISDNHDIVKNNTNAEEPLPLNDPFVGDSSISGGVTIITDDNITSERKKIDLYNFKLVGIIKSQGASFVSLINQDGENINIEMFEELNDGVKLVDLTTKEAVFQTEDTYLIMNFKNEIKEKSEY